jgi:hypothetical protein
MEILYAFDRGKRVIVVVPEHMPLSPWITYHATEVHRTLEAGIEALIGDLG